MFLDQTGVTTDRQRRLLLAFAVLARMAYNKATSVALGRDYHFKFTNMAGFFMQDEASTDPDSFDYVRQPRYADLANWTQATTNMGILTRSYPTDDPSEGKSQWHRLATYVQHLNRAAKPGQRYKILFLGRHGEGFHNVQEARVGTEMWDVRLFLDLKFNN